MTARWAIDRPAIDGRGPGLGSDVPFFLARTGALVEGPASA